MRHRRPQVRGRARTRAGRSRTGLAGSHVLPDSATDPCRGAGRGGRPVYGRLRTGTSAPHDHRGPVAEESLVGGDADAGALDLSALGLSAQLPGELADLRQRLSRHRLTEARETARGVDRDPAADGRVARAQQRLRLAAGAEPEVLDPVELEGGGEVVDLGNVDVLGADAGF